MSEKRECSEIIEIHTSWAVDKVGNITPLWKASDEEDSVVSSVLSALAKMVILVFLEVVLRINLAVSVNTGKSNDFDSGS